MVSVIGLSSTPYIGTQIK